MRTPKAPVRSLALLSLCLLALCACGGAGEGKAPAADKAPDQAKPADGAAKGDAPAEAAKGDDKAKVDLSAFKPLVEPPSTLAPGPLSDAEKAEVDKLIAALPDAYGPSLTALHAYGPGIEPQILTLLDDTDQTRRALGVKVVGNLRLKGAYNKVAQMLEDKDARVRRQAIKVLGECDDPTLTAKLERFVDSPEVSQWMRSARYLGNAGLRRSMKDLRLRGTNELLVWRLRALEVMGEVAVPSDWDWFKEQLTARRAQSFNEAKALWRGAAQADPVKTWLLLRKTNEKKALPERQFRAAMQAITPHVPEEEVLLLAKQLIGPKQKPRVRNFVRVLAATPTPDAIAEVDKLIGKGHYLCDIWGARFQREVELKKLQNVLLIQKDDPDVKDLKGIELRLKQIQSALDLLTPLSAQSAKQMAEHIKNGNAACRSQVMVMDHAHLTKEIVGLLAASDPKARQGAAYLFGRHGQWSDIPEMMKLYNDADPRVRDEVRAALRNHVGIDLRLDIGFIWPAWYMRTFGPIPKGAFPAADLAAAAKDDLARSLKIRPPASEPKSYPQNGRVTW